VEIARKHTARLAEATGAAAASTVAPAEHIPSSDAAKPGFAGAAGGQPTPEGVVLPIEPMEWSELCSAEWYIKAWELSSHPQRLQTLLLVVIAILQVFVVLFK